MDERVFQKAGLIHKVGNRAVHERSEVKAEDAMQVVRDLHHFCYWLTRTYAPDHPRDGAGWKDERVPQPLPATWCRASNSSSLKPNSPPKAKKR